MARNQRDREALARLVTQAQAGDRAAFDELYRRTAQAQFYLMAAKVGYDAAADLLQELYLIAWRNIQNVQPYAVLGYLGSVGRNLCRQQAERAQRARRSVPLEPDALEGDDATDEVAAALHDTSTDPASAAIAADEHRRLARALREELTDFERACVVMRYYQGAKIDEIAEALESSRNTVKRTLSRALLTLRTKMGLAPWGALGLSGALADAVESRMAAGARALERRRPWFSLATGAVGAAAIGVTAGAVAFAVLAPPPAEPVAEAQPVVIEEAGVPAASSAEVDTTAPQLDSVRVEDGTTVLRFTDETGVRDVWCEGPDGTVYHPASHEDAPGTPARSAWRFNLPTGTYEAHAVDEAGNESAGEITCEIYSDDPVSVGPNS
ncbi:sigma-70 family RNA polymerase sigma factor [Adlercreutzia sp. R7]|uniref:Sigma-70 family RNA polymerase sigma factor n=1 Tax=Adlercreutzia wanghongyangiae TaxID=3111451 RepID=A0ABU6IEQ9_9ACTN|nr:sigma-70 family RNA polymerase sigma factor [Adlercreutzia sp. R7]